MKITIQDSIILYTYHANISPTIGEKLTHLGKVYKIKKLSYFVKETQNVDYKRLATDNREYEVLAHVERI